MKLSIVGVSLFFLLSYSIFSSELDSFVEDRLRQVYDEISMADIATAVACSVSASEKMSENTGDRRHLMICGDMVKRIMYEIYGNKLVLTYEKALDVLNKADVLVKDEVDLQKIEMALSRLTKLNEIGTRWIKTIERVSPQRWP